MERSEKAGLGIALAGHAGLFALLSLRFLQPAPLPSLERPMAVSLVDEVGPSQAAPPAPTPPSMSQAPEQGSPEDVSPAPAEPAPKPAPAPKAVVEAKPAPKPLAEPKPAPAPKPAARPQPAPANTAAPARPDRLAAVVAEAGHAAHPPGSRLGADFLKGLSDTPSKAPPSAAAPGATMSAQATADIGSAILRQVQPCADRQVNPGPGAERIRVAINLRLNRDGSLAAPPRVVNHDGLDGENRRYLDRVDDLAIATFTGCAPLKGLPAALYDVPNGWRSFTLRYKLPG